MRKIKTSDLRNRVRCFVRLSVVAHRFVACIPDDHARMIPAFLHPFRILTCDLSGMEPLGPYIPPGASVPDGEFILYEVPFLVGYAVPFFRCQADAVAEAVP